MKRKERKSEHKVYSSVLTQRVDADGVVISEEEENKVKTKDKEPKFVKFYLDDIIHFYNLPKGITGDVLLFLAKHMSYNNMICVIKPLKQIIANQLDTSLDSVNRALKALKKSGVIHSVDRGLYLIDPYLFAKGNWGDIRSLRLIVDYDADKNVRKLSSNAGAKLEQLKFLFDAGVEEQEEAVLEEKDISAAEIPSTDFEDVE